MAGQSVIGFSNISGDVFSSGVHSLFWLFVIVFLIFAAILVYHWQKYGGHSRTFFVIETVFAVGSLILGIIAFLALQSI